ncbi:MAG: F0F1 ATP synthase subunit delta [Prevotellaceae bacterium]|jgi:F-type H+-transporting ATPase subunit delta|nr:F0F1 ATP synthase subunit delta [Prevotellaceae bacterium]
MDTGTITRRYAMALWMYAKKNGAEEQVYAQTKQLFNSFSHYPSLKRVLSNRLVSIEKKVEVVVLATGKEQDVFKNFIRLVLTNKRESYLPSICLSYETIYLREKKILKAKLVTAIPLDSNLEQRFIQKLEQRTGHTIQISTQVNPDIVGGYVVTLDCWRLDASVTGYLKQIKEQLLQKAINY